MKYFLSCLFVVYSYQKCDVCTKPKGLRRISILCCISFLQKVHSTVKKQSDNLTTHMNILLIGLPKYDRISAFSI